MLCRDLDKGKDQCHYLASEYEDLIEEWWLHHQDTSPDLTTWLCIDKVQHCCPPNHYGANCSPCKAITDKQLPCSGHGKCKGSGSRKGDGSCLCSAGYGGAVCVDCVVGYYEEDGLCLPCDEACNGPCTGFGPKACVACKDGWMSDTEHGCMDIDECQNKESPCTKQEFCINGIGSYSCLLCDKSCSGCDGDGPDMCYECAEGYTVQEGVCVEDKPELNESVDDPLPEEGSQPNTSEEL